MKLTKLQRYTAYCIMLEYIRGTPSNLFSIWNTLTMDDSWRTLESILPELYSRRTNKHTLFTDLWFSNHAERITALKACIAETAPK